MATLAAYVLALLSLMCAAVMLEWMIKRLLANHPGDWPGLERPGYWTIMPKTNSRLRHYIWSREYESHPDPWIVRIAIIFRWLVVLSLGCVLASLIFFGLLIMDKWLIGHF